MATVGQTVKSEIVRELSALLSKRSNVFITAVSSLSAPETDLLRRNLNEPHSQLVRVQRTLGLRVLSSLAVAGTGDLLEGPIGLVFSGDDVVLTAKRLVEFRKTHEEQLAIRGAIIEGQLLDRQKVEYLAHLPARVVLLTQVLATIESPLADVIFTLERLIGDVVGVIEQAATKKPKKDEDK